MFRHKKRRVPFLNTTSTADISFMLLILFLVTTSMDIDKGLARQLPPLDDNTEQLAMDVSKSNVLRLELTADNGLMADGKPVETGDLRKIVMDFVGVQADRSSHVISVDVDRNADYNTYFNMQNEIMAAYNTLRDMRARRIYRRSYDRCTPEQKRLLREYYPQRIAETYPQEEGGEEQ